METNTFTPDQLQSKYLQDLIRLLIEKYQPLRIISFGRNSLIKQHSGCFIEEVKDGYYHHFLLMVTESVTRIEHEVQDFANRHYEHGTITILVHGKETISEAVAANSRFFCTVLNHGEQLYSNDGIVMMDYVGGYVPTHAVTKAQNHLYHRMPLAGGFLTGAKECIGEEKYNVAVFMLHQVVEQCCIALISVHLAYRSDIHNLYRLLRLCNSFSSAPSALFLSGREEDERLFEILVKSYSAARYNDSFDVAQTDAEKLYIRISTFVKLVKMMCDDKIKKLEQETESYNQLNKGMEVQNG